MAGAIKTLGAAATTAKIPLEEQLKDAEEKLDQTYDDKAFEMKKEALAKEKEANQEHLDKKLHDLNNNNSYQLSELNSFFTKVKTQYNDVSNEILGIMDKYKLPMTESVVEPFEKGRESVNHLIEALKTLHEVQLNETYSPNSNIGFSNNSNISSGSSDKKYNFEKDTIHNLDRRARELEGAMAKASTPNEYKEFIQDWKSLQAMAHAEANKIRILVDDDPNTREDDTPEIQALSNRWFAYNDHIKYLEELIRRANKAKFSAGGLVELAKRNGEDGIALVRNGEIILSQRDSNVFKEFVKNLTPLNNLSKDFMKGFKNINISPHLATATGDNISVNIDVHNGNFDGVTLSQCKDVIRNEVIDLVNRKHK